MTHFDPDSTQVNGTPEYHHEGAHDYDYESEYNASYRAPMPEPARPRPRWVIPAAGALTVAALVGGIAGITMLNRSDSDAPSPTVAAASSESTSAPTASPSEETSTPSDDTSSESEASSSQTTDDFPSSAGTSCAEGDSTGQVSEPDVRTGTDSSSCAYVTNVRQEVLDAISGGATDTFEIRPYSATRGDVIPLNCSRTNHLSHCTGGKNVDVYVQDSLS